jgi:hypothetical protein
MAERREHPDESEEPEPIDPKAASRAIKRHIERKKATEVRRKAPEEDPAPERAPAPKPQPPPEPKTPPAPPAAEEGEPSSGVLAAVSMRNRDLIALMEHSPESLMEEWLQIQLGDAPRRALSVSRTEMEFLLLKRSLMD